MKFTLSPSCREASRLITERMDRPLTMGERVGLRFHLAICHACPRLVAQMNVMRDALKRWTRHVEED